MIKMIERVAEGQAAFDGRTLAAMSRAERERYRERARIAIRDMREPTDAMLGAFDRLTDDSGSVLVKTGYRAMIDEALRD